MQELISASSGLHRKDISLQNMQRGLESEVLHPE